MQQLQDASDSGVTPDGCAREVLAGIPVVMRFIRQQMRRHRQVDLSVPQFRALVFLSINDDTSLSAMAEHLGLSLPATSRMVELLVKRGLMERRPQIQDRRRVSLSLTKRGIATYQKTLSATQIALADSLKPHSPQELVQVIGAMRILSRAFAGENGRSDPVK